MPAAAVGTVAAVAAAAPSSVLRCFTTAQVQPSSCIMLASAVSSRALGAMAAVEGFAFEQTLTGFKWLGNIAQQRAAQGKRVLFAFEEAIGFMFPDVGMVRRVPCAACSGLLH